AVPPQAVHAGRAPHRARRRRRGRSNDVRVLQVDSGREWRGGQNQVRLLARELARAGVDQVLATKRGSDLARRAASEDVTVAGLPWALGLDPRAAWWLRRLVTHF